MSYSIIQKFVLITLTAMAIVTARADDLSDALAGCSTYRDALLSKEGDAAWGAIDSKTQEYYASIAKMALGASREELRKQDIIKKMTILRCRIEFKKEVLGDFRWEFLWKSAALSNWCR